MSASGPAQASKNYKPLQIAYLSNSTYQNFHECWVEKARRSRGVPPWEQPFSKTFSESNALTVDAALREARIDKGDVSPESELAFCRLQDQD